MTRDLFSRIWLVGVAGFAVLMLLDLTGAYSPPSLVSVIVAGVLLVEIEAIRQPIAPFGGIVPREQPSIFPL